VKKKKTVQDFYAMKEKREPVTFITSYDYPTATFAEKAEMDMILVGDSLGMCVYGYEGTMPVKLGGDLIVAFDGQQITSPQDLAEAMNAKHAGDTVTVTVFRGRKKMDIHVTLGDAKDQTQGT